MVYHRLNLAAQVVTDCGNVHAISIQKRDACDNSSTFIAVEKRMRKGDTSHQERSLLNDIRLLIVGDRLRPLKCALQCASIEQQG